MAKTLKNKRTGEYIRVLDDEAKRLVDAGTHHCVPKKGNGRPVYIEDERRP